jgi:long-chain acyl-CoA synthetase
MLERLVAGAAAWPERPLIEGPDAVWTWASALGAVRTSAASMAAAGIGPKRGVVILAERHDESYLSLLAAWSLGAVAVPLNLTLPAADRQAVIARCGDAVLWDEGRIGPALASTAAVDSLSQATAGVIMFTSGSTGVPKGVPLRLDQLWANAVATVAASGMQATDRVLVNTPPYFVSALCHFLATLAAGGTFIGRTGFHFGASLLETLRDTRATVFGGAPIHLVRAATGASTADWPPELRLWFSSGDALMPDTIAAATAAAPHVRIDVMYGLTEVAGRLCHLRDAGRSPRRGSVGAPLPGMEVRVLDDDGHELPAGIEGELYVRGPMLMTGYLGDDSPSVGARGFRTGDRGHHDGSGHFWLTGRADDVFKVSGEKVSARRVEEELLRLPSVLEAAVVAVDDELVGRSALAYVVLQAGAPTDKLQMLRTLRDRLPGSHLPRRIEIVPALPRTGSGKIKRGQLRTARADAATDATRGKEGSTC